MRTKRNDEAGVPQQVACPLGGDTGVAPPDPAAPPCPGAPAQSSSVGLCREPGVSDSLTDTLPLSASHLLSHPGRDVWVQTRIASAQCLAAFLYKHALCQSPCTTHTHMPMGETCVEKMHCGVHPCKNGPMENK